jgi:trimeric autotransporter adhesin
MLLKAFETLDLWKLWIGDKMKKIFGLVGLLLTGAFAATSALYLHHERSTQATVEADCQNREICLDKVNLAPLGRFNDGTLWHGVTQEKPNVNLTGALTVTGATVLSNNLTLSLFATGRIPYTTTAGLLTSGTGLTYNGSAFSVTGTGAFSGNVNINGATDVTATRVNVAAGNIAVSRSAGAGGAYSAYGLGDPATALSAGNTEILQLFHDGTNAAITVNKTGAGSYRSLLIQNGGSTAITVATNQGVSLSSTLNVTGASTTTGITNTGNIVSQSNSTSNIEIIRATTDAVAPQLKLKKTRGTIGSETDVVNGDNVLSIVGQAQTGGGYYSGAEIDFYVDGAVSSGQRPPSRMEFYTNLSNAAQTKQFSISSTGAAQFTSTLGITGVTTATGGLNVGTATVSTAAEFDGSKNLVSVTKTGSGNDVYSASPTLTGTISAASQTLSGTLGVTGVTSATGGLTLGASFVDKTTSLTSNTTLTSAHSTILASASGGSFTLTLPAASGNTGLTYTIYKTDVTAAATGGGNTVTIDGNGSETIGGALTQVLASNTGNGVIRIICDGSNWQIQSFYDEGTYTATGTGFTANPTGTAKYYRTGKSSVMINLPLLAGTSNAASFTVTGLPASLVPSTTKRFSVTNLITDNSTTYAVGFIDTQTNAVMTVYYATTLTNMTSVFTGSGTKGFGELTLIYPL